MPNWVLLLSADSVDAVRVEQEIRLAGYSPRRAPDLPRAQVLLGQGERPAAVVIDLVSTGEEGLRAVRALTPEDDRLPLVALTPDADGALAASADRAGAAVLPLDEVRSGVLATMLGELAGR